MKNYYEQFENCREHDAPFCADTCPFKMDVLDLQEKMVKKRYNVAYKTIRDSVVFPEIVTALCPAYCQKTCPRGDIDSPVQISMLEKTAVAKATRKKPNAYNLPAKKGKVAVIGAGISGLGFAFRLASKKYDVTVYEQSDKIGGHLWGLLNEDIFLNDFDLQFKNEKYTLKLNTKVENIDSLLKEDYNVIYIATGKDGNDFGLTENNQYCTEINNTAVFLGGSICGHDTINALASGLDISKAAEVYIKIKKIEYPTFELSSKVVANEDLLVETPPIKATDDDGTFTDEEAVKEASRCIRCQCDACQNYCDLVDYFNKWPIFMRDEILLTCKPSKSMIHKNPAMRYINTCTQCGIFSEVCPGDIDLCDMIKSARRKIHTLDKTPGAFRQYWLRDMAFANGEYAAVKKFDLASASPDDNYAFFPGCNLGALNPDYVLKPFKWLLKKKPSMGLLLRCCSIPVDWNGEEDLHNEEIAKLKQDWIDMGKPTLIMACMSCSKHLQEYLPEIPLISLYEVLDQWGFDFEDKAAASWCNNSNTTYSVFDPCSARNQDEVQYAVRNLANTAGISLEELPKGDKHGCCGFGGMGSIATPEFAKHVADKRSDLSTNPYIVYCSNCRDVFNDNDKPVIHILDALFNINADNELPQPSVTERRKNRVTLKEKLLKEIWSEDMKSKPEESKYKLKISPDIQFKINKQRILEEDICNVIDYAETTGRKTINPENNHYKAYHEIGNITCWVEYGITPEDEYEIFNVYTHRMHIDLEVIFNGRKIDVR